MRNFFYIIWFFSNCVYSLSPAWLTEPAKTCPSNEICVIGTGKSLERSTAVARDEMAKTLKVKIIANTNFNTFSSQVREDEVVLGHVSEKFNRGIEEISEEILEGSFVKESYKDKEDFYVFMGLDKLKTGNIIKNKILLMDEYIEHLYLLGKRAALFEAVKIYPMREELNSRYEFLMGDKIIPKVNLGELNKQKERFFKKNTKIFLKFFDFKQEDNLKKYIIQKFLELGLVQSLDPKEKDVYTIKVYFDFKKSFLNVEGFEKYQYNLSAYCYNQNFIKIGTINFTTGETGRNFTQAKENAMVRIKQFLGENISQLNID